MTEIELVEIVCKSFTQKLRECQSEFEKTKGNHSVQEIIFLFDCQRKSSFTMLLSVIGKETEVTSSNSQVEKKSSCLYFPMTQSSCFFMLILSPMVFFSVLAITNVTKMQEI